MNKLAFLIALFMLNISFSGCLEAEDKRIVIEEPGLFDFDKEIPETTWYHYSGGVNAIVKESLSDNISGNKKNFWTQVIY